MLKRSRIKNIFTFTIAVNLLALCAVSSIHASTATYSSPEANQQVSVYVASWCPHCRKATTYLENLEIPYIAYDIDTPIGQEKFESLQASGIPIIFVGDYRMDGFNPIQLEKILCNHALLQNCPAVS